MAGELRILQIEDDKAWLTIVRRWFDEQQGIQHYKLVQSDSLVSAIRTISEPRNPRFDVLIVDINFVPQSELGQNQGKLNDLIRLVDVIEDNPTYRERPHIIALSGVENFEDTLKGFNGLRPGWISNWYRKNGGSTVLLGQEIMQEVLDVELRRGRSASRNYTSLNAWAIFFGFFILVPLLFLSLLLYNPTNGYIVVLALLLYLLVLLIILPYLCLWNGLIKSDELPGLLNAPIDTIKHALTVLFSNLRWPF
ncbi:MAG: hypothetical protein KF832_19575 [Caldilineaceae bacterium]|nr:hypothetical protein [Caldilineaceae bacterium]